MTGRATDSRLVLTYVEDHVSAATGVLSRVEQMAGADRLPAHVRAELRTIADDIAVERQWLIDLAHRMGDTPSPVKRTLAWLAEHAGRLKLNGRVTTASPLSPVLELELLWGGLRGKRSGWMTLREWAAELDIDPAELEEKIAASDAQSERVAALLAEMRRQAFAATA